MSEIVDQLLAIAGKLAQEHWSFVAVAILLGVIGEVIKGIVLGKDNSKVESSKFHSLFKKTLPVHPIAAGAALGIILVSLLPESISSGGLIGSVLYFAVSGAVSTSLYETLKMLYPAAIKLLRNKVAEATSSAKDKE